MARGVNRVTLIGNLGDDPSTKYTQGGTAVTRISLATSSEWKDKSGEKKERVDWHRVVFWGKLAEIAGEYLRKGSQVYVEGSIKYDKFTGQDGVEKYTTDIIADEMQMLGGRGDGGEGRQQRPSGSQRPARTEAGRQYRDRAEGGNTPPLDTGGPDDDIPF